MSVGGRIRELREKAKLKQKQLAVLIDIEPGSLGNWERENRNPRVDDLIAINEALKPKIGDHLFYLVTGRTPFEYIDNYTIGSAYIEKSKVLEGIEEFLTKMDMMKEIKLVAPIDQLVSVFSDIALESNCAGVLDIHQKQQSEG